MLNESHGLSSTRVYHAWQDMKKRCLNERSERYKNYGGRGIRICRRWMSFKAFFADMGHPPTNQHQLERKNNNRNYGPKNCRWATAEEQCLNKTNSAFIKIQGVKKNVATWCKEYGIHPATFYSRIRTGWTAVEAVTTPIAKHTPGAVYKRGQLFTIDGVTMTMPRWCEKFGIRSGTVRMRLMLGWTPEEAVKTPIQGTNRV